MRGTNMADATAVQACWQVGHAPQFTTRSQHQQATCITWAPEHSYLSEAIELGAPLC